MKNIKKIDIHAHAVAFPQYVPNCFPGGHSSPLRLDFLSMIKNLHHIMPSPFEKLRIFREGGPRQRWMRCWNLSGGKNKQYRRAGARSCRLVWDYINGKNDNIVGQGLAPAVRCRIKSMAKNNNIVGQGLAPAVW